MEFSVRSRTNPCNWPTATFSVHRVRKAQTGWRVHFERTSDLGQTWAATPPVNDGKEISAIQPSILFHPGGRLQALGRTKQGKIFEIWSNDDGKTWGKMTLTSLPNPNSGIDAVTLKDGRQLLVYNHNAAPKGRSPLNVAVSQRRERMARGAGVGRRTRQRVLVSGGDSNQRRPGPRHLYVEAPTYQT